MRDDRRQKLSAVYSLGVLVHFAFNNAKKFPTQEKFIGPEKSEIITDPKEQAAMMKKFFEKAN